jgi:low affinity Fe/Cu permease
MQDFFRRIAHKISELVGTSWAFIIAFLLIVAWAVAGPFFEYSNTWQLVINTGTTILTFLMVFLIQNTQNRDSHAIHLKLDELIRAMDPARDKLIDIENMSDKELDKLAEEFKVFKQGHEERGSAIEHERVRRRSRKP